MKNAALFIIAFFAVGFLILMGEYARTNRDASPDYQAYRKPRVEFQE